MPRDWGVIQWLVSELQWLESCEMDGWNMILPMLLGPHAARSRVDNALNVSLVGRYPSKRVPKGLTSRLPNPRREITSRGDKEAVAYTVVRGLTVGPDGRAWVTAECVCVYMHLVTCLYVCAW